MIPLGQFLGRMGDAFLEWSGYPPNHPGHAGAFLFLHKHLKRLRDSVPKPASDGITFHVPFEQAVPNWADYLVKPFIPDRKERPIFRVFSYQYVEPNLGDPKEAVKYTPFEHVFKITIPITLPHRSRFEHTHILARTGAGKSESLLQFLIGHDIDAMAQGEHRSVIVIDSQGSKGILPSIRQLKVFAKGEPLENRLVIISPSNPFPLSLFSIGRASSRNAEQYRNAMIELLSFALGSLLSQDLTGKQRNIFDYTVMALLELPNSTLETFRHFLTGGYKDYRSRLSHLDADTIGVFEHEYYSAEYLATRSEVLRRLRGLARNQTLMRLLNNPTSEFDLGAELSNGKVILIDTDVGLLQPTGTEILGRFFLMWLALIAIQRGVEGADLTPTFIYIDEFGDYSKNADSSIDRILKQARKFNMGFHAAHTLFSDLSLQNQAAINSNTATKFAAALSHSDEVKMVAEMRAREYPQLFRGLPKGTFVGIISGIDRPLRITFPHGTLDHKPQMSDKEYNRLILEMQKNYTPKTITKPVVPVPPEPAPHDEVSPPPRPTATGVSVELEHTVTETKRVKIQAEKFTGPNLFKPKR